MRKVSIIALALITGFSVAERESAAAPNNRARSSRSAKRKRSASVPERSVTPAAVGPAPEAAPTPEPIATEYRAAELPAVPEPAAPEQVPAAPVLSLEAATSETVLTEETAAAAKSAATIAEIKARWNTSYEKAKDECSGIAKKIDGVKILAGVSTGASALGTLSAGAATVTGIMKTFNDKKIKELDDKVARLANLSAPGNEQALRDALDNNEIANILDDMEKARVEREEAVKKSRTLGTIRTAGSFVAGGTSAVSAVTSFIGVDQLDKIAKDMDSCSAAVREIGFIRSELAAESPNDPDLTMMDEVVGACSGLNSKNIIDIKNKLTATGIVSAVGTATGIAGGITSAIAGSKEKQGASAMKSEKEGGTKGLNLASNILAGVTTATSLGSTVISGITLADLNKNDDRAKDCAGKF
ncbi:MAG: hypothetical protein LBT92_04375 [Rickettsiales bacterium]|nr:hypothetical protein [Rickettsiales bacterium]